MPERSARYAIARRRTIASATARSWLRCSMLLRRAQAVRDAHGHTAPRHALVLAQRRRFHAHDPSERLEPGYSRIAPQSAGRVRVRQRVRVLRLKIDDSKSDGTARLTAHTRRAAVSQRRGSSVGVLGLTRADACLFAPRRVRASRPRPEAQASPTRERSVRVATGEVVQPPSAAGERARLCGAIPTCNK